MTDKKLPPSPQRLKEAREKGQVAVSRDLVNLSKLAVVGEIAFSQATNWLGQFGETIDAAIGSIPRSIDSRLDVSGHIGSGFAATAIGLAAIAAGLACLVTLLQTGFNIAGKAFEEGPKKLDPATNLQNLVSSQKLMMLLIGPVKVALVLFVCYAFLKGRLTDMLHMYLLTLEQGWAYSVDVLHSLFHAVLVALVALGGLDYALQRFISMKELRMDIEDQKREHKENEGDPHLKGHRKGIAAQMRNEKPKKNVVRPDAVVVNPQHIAIALKNDPSGKGLPWIVEKAAGEAAMRLRHQASRDAIPVIRYVSLARILYATGHEGAYVPSQTIRSVALVYSALSELQGISVQPGDEFEINPEMLESMVPSVMPAATAVDSPRVKL